jgi:hypothetical protein
VDTRRTKQPDTSAASAAHQATSRPCVVLHADIHESAREGERVVLRNAAKGYGGFVVGTLGVRTPESEEWTALIVERVNGWEALVAERDALREALAGMVREFPIPRGNVRDNFSKLVAIEAARAALGKGSPQST